MARDWSINAFAQAVAQARKSFEEGGVPIGAALEKQGDVIAVGHNERVQLGDPIAHGEIACLRAAGRQVTYRDSVLYTTLAPCAMCSGAIVLFKIPLVVVGEAASFPGELEFLRQRSVDVIVVDDDECIQLMQAFQKRRPDIWAEDIGEPPAARADASQ